MAFMRIKSEPHGDNDEFRDVAPRGFRNAPRSPITAAKIREINRRNEIDFEHARETQERRDNIRKRCARTRTCQTSSASSSSSAGSSSSSSFSFIESDECVNSDEERSRKASEYRYEKELDRQAKRARRRPNPPDEWKDTLDRMRPDNVMLCENDLRRETSASTHGLISTIDDDGLMIDTNGIVHLQDGTIPRVTGKKNKKHIGYDAHVPLVAQQYYVPMQPVLSDRVIDTLERIDNETQRSKPVPMFDDAGGSINVPMTAFTLATNLTPENIEKGITVPTSHHVSTSASGLDALMLYSRTDDQGRLFSERFLHEVVCPPEDLNFIFNKLRKDTLYNCPLSQIGPIDDYVAFITSHKRKVNERMSRECIAIERECVEGRQCIGRRIPNSTPITLVEYFTMASFEEMRKAGHWTTPPRHCILCKWNQATKTAFNILAECAAYSDKMVQMRSSGASKCDAKRRALVLVDFCDLVGEGEYSPYDVIVSNLNRFIGLVAPVVIFVLKRFKQQKVDGIFHYIHDYEQSNRNLEDWVTLVSRESLLTKSAYPMRATSSLPTQTNKFFLPPPPLRTSVQQRD